MVGVRIATYQQPSGLIANISIGVDIQAASGFAAGDKVDVLIGDGSDAGRMAIQKGSLHPLSHPPHREILQLMSRPIGRVIGHAHKASACQIIESECAQGRIVFSLPPKVFARMSADTASVAAVA